MGEGLRWLWGSQVLRVLCLLLALVNGTFAAVSGILVLYAQEVLGLGERGYGLLLSVIALGTVAGSALAGMANRVLGPARIVPFLMVSQGVAMLAVAATGSLTVAVAGFFVGGVASGLWNISTISLRQRIVPDRLLGRVTSAYRMVGLGAMPLGALAGGVLARAYSLTSTLVVAGALSLLGTAAALRWFTARDVAAALDVSGSVADPSRPA
jgi:predicted MFS family arabinose efflux permease